MQSSFKIGLIVKPQGIRGELKVQPLTSDINRFKNLNEVKIDGQSYRITRTVIAGDTVFVALSGVSDRNTAETFRGKFMSVERKDAIPLKDGEYFVADLVGAAVFDEDGEIGKITDIISARTDIFTVATKNGKVLRFPFLKDAVKSIDVEKGEVTVFKKKLAEISVYED